MRVTKSKTKNMFAEYLDLSSESDSDSELETLLLLYRKSRKVKKKRGTRGEFVPPNLKTKKKHAMTCKNPQSVERRTSACVTRFLCQIHKSAAGPSLSSSALPCPAPQFAGSPSKDRVTETDLPCLRHLRVHVRRA